MFDKLSKFQSFCLFFKQLYGYVKSITTYAKLARHYHFEYDDSEIVLYGNKPGETKEDVIKRMQEDLKARLMQSVYYTNEMNVGLSILSLVVGFLGLSISLFSLFL
jgi:hypothetical protein